MRRRVLLLCSVLGLLFLATTLVIAHPHFSKTITVKLPGGADAVVTYQTTPANEIHAQKAVVGEFVTPRNPRLKLSADVKAGAVTIPMGEYLIGVIKNGENDWTMALYPGTIARGQKADMSKVIKLESVFLTSEGKAEHMLIDISPGVGKLDGRAMLTIHFGSLFLGGALS